MSVLFAIVRKELRDGLRDARSVLSATSFALIGPLLIAITLNRVVETASDVRTTKLPVVGAEHASSLVAYLRAHGVEIEAAPPDPEARITDGTIPALLVISDDYGEDFRAARRAHVELRFDSSKQATAGAVRRVRSLVDAYGQQTGTLRLLARGVSPELTAPVSVDEVDLATPEKRAAALLDLIVMFLMLSAFIGPMYLAIDTTAGERERGSLEPLLTTPVARSTLVIGKWIAAVAIGACGLALTLVLMMLMLEHVSTENLGARIALGPVMTLHAMAIMLPVVLLAAAVQLFVATFAKSYKEAQTYLTLTLLGPTVGGLVLSLDLLKPTRAWYRIPVLTQELQCSALLRGEHVDASLQIAGLFTTFGAAAILLLATSWLFRRESLLFR